MLHQWNGGDMPPVPALDHGTGKEKRMDLIYVLGGIAVWIALQRFVLPAFGVPT
jgi:hypothetical protein